VTGFKQLSVPPGVIMTTSRLPFGFYKPTPTDHVVKYRGGKMVASGTGVLFLITPWHTFARVPTTVQTIPVSFTELTSDRLGVFVQGEIHIRLDVEAMLTRHDFSVDPWTGIWMSDDPTRLTEDAGKALQGYVRALIKDRTLEEVIVAASDLETEVLSAIAVNDVRLAKLGMRLEGLFITSVKPENRQLSAAIEAKKREEMLAGADKAVSARRMDAASSERELKQYEAETARAMEETRTALIEIRNRNVIAEAVADADAAAKKLEPYRDVDPAVLLALAIEKMAVAGVGEFNLTSDLLSAFRRKE